MGIKARPIIAPHQSEQRCQRIKNFNSALILSRTV
jgi:hypothetical protein